MPARHSITLIVASVLFVGALAGEADAAAPKTTVLGGNFSAPGSVYVPPPPPRETVPKPPTGFGAYSKTTHSMHLAWRDQSQVESGYRIELLSGASWVTVAELGPITEKLIGEWRATGLRHDREYCWRAVPYNAWGEPTDPPVACVRTNRILGPNRVLVRDLVGLQGELADPQAPPYEPGRLTVATTGAPTPASDPPAFTVPPAVKIITIADGVQLDLSYSILTIPPGISLESGRGGVRQGALLYTTVTRSEPLITVYGDNVRISGLRFRGPSASTSDSLEKTYAIKIRNARDVVIDHNEFYDWPGAGVKIEHEPGLMNALTAYRVRVTENYFHHNQRQNAGYGVVVADCSYAWIDKNTFDWNRHAIASDGGRHHIVPGYGPEHGYLAYLNLVLPGHAEQEYLGGLYERQTHHFDVHGSESNWLGVDFYDGWAGEFFDIADNSFLGILGTAFNIRGTPSNSAHFHHNVLPQVVLLNGAVIGLDGGVSYYGWFSVNSESDRDNVYVSNNLPTADPRQRLAVGDFDGDGRDDVFLATGRAWYVSYGGITEWRFLNKSSRWIGTLSFVDHDGDGRTDVLTRQGGVWHWSRSGSGPLVALATTPVVPPQSFRSGSDLIGDFSGDGVLDRLRFDRTGDRYFRTVDGVSGATVRSRYQM